jgi:UDP-N-acetylglucosamine 4,6-dehydratase
VTGCTGYFGRKFAVVMLCERKPKRLIIFSRDEPKQYKNVDELFRLLRPSLPFGDIRDCDCL